MKKFLTVLLVVLMTLCLAGCKEEKSKMELAKEAGKITIANVVNGTLGDKSFFDSGEEGVKAINQDFGDKVYAETIELTYNKDTWQTGLEEVCKAGWDIIICGTYDMKEHVIAVSANYPDQKWWFYDEEWNFSDANGWQYAPIPGLYAMMFAQNEGSFVVGAAAAMLTDAGKVAFMGGQDNTVLDDFFVGYANGAKYIDATVEVNCTWMNSFSDSTIGKDKASGLYEAGYDVVFACGGQAGLGGFDAVVTTTEGHWIIGVDGNQGEYFQGLGAKGDTVAAQKAERTITSMQKNVNKGFYTACEKMLAGTLAYGTNEKLGLKGGYVSYSITDTTNKVFTKEQLAKLDEIVAGIIAGTIDPGTAFGHEEGWFATFVESVK